MDFINPKIDFAFKKIFGDEQNKDILISFLNAILYDAQPIILDLEILDPYLAPKRSGLKDTFLDIRAQIRGGEYVIIEMQVLAVEGFAKRVLYNVTKAYSTQLKPKEDYTTLSPVIGLTITDFVMFKKIETVRSRFVLYDKEHEVEYPDNEIELVFVELPKFKKQLPELETLTEKWLYFLRYADTLEEVPEPMQAEPVIDKAFQIANRVNLTQEELDELEQREFFVRDMQRLVASSVQAIQKAKKEIQQAREKAQQAEEKAQQAEEKAQQAEEEAQQAEEEAQQAEEEGKRERSIEIARQLLDVLDDKIISQKTGLTIEEVRRLREEGK